MKTRPEESSEFSEPFKTIDQNNYGQLLKLLKGRLPRSAHVYNMALILDDFPEEMEAYSLGNLSCDAIIMIIFNREDYGQDINLSIPDNFCINEKTKESFASTKVIAWNKMHWFCGTDRQISPMIFELETFWFRNSVKFNPNYTYWMDTEDALKLKIEERPGVEVKPLDTLIGLEFLVKTWKFSREGAEEYLKKIIDKHISAGVFEDGDLACGAVVNGHGLIGILNTAENYKRKGYATMCMQYMIKGMAKKGFIPVSTSQQENYLSVNLHAKVGMKLSHECDYIMYVPYVSTK